MNNIIDESIKYKSINECYPSCMLLPKSTLEKLIQSNYFKGISYDVCDLEGYDDMVKVKFEPLQLEFIVDYLKYTENK